MTTLIELRNLATSSDLRNKIEAAIMISADKVMRGNDGAAPFSQGAGAHDLRVIWAKSIFESLIGQAERFLRSVLASNATASVATITSATDASIQANVDEAVDLMAGVAV